MHFFPFLCFNAERIAKVSSICISYPVVFFKKFYRLERKIRSLKANGDCFPNLRKIVQILGHVEMMKQQGVLIQDQNRSGVAQLINSEINDNVNVYF